MSANPRLMRLFTDRKHDTRGTAIIKRLLIVPITFDSPLISEGLDCSSYSSKIRDLSPDLWDGRVWRTYCLEPLIGGGGKGGCNQRVRAAVP